MMRNEALRRRLGSAMEKLTEATLEGAKKSTSDVEAGLVGDRVLANSNHRPGDHLRAKD